MPGPRSSAPGSCTPPCRVESVRSATATATAAIERLSAAGRAARLSYGADAA